MELPLLLNLALDVKVPLHRQIYEQVRVAVLTGKVKANQKLPASRQLAKTLGISRTTVVQGYDQLISEGYLQTQLGAGTFVCAQIPEALIETDANAGADTGTRAADLSASQTNLSAYGDRLTPDQDYSYPPDCPLSFRYGLPDLKQFPIQIWRRLMSAHLLADTDWMSYDSEPMGYAPLREQIARYITQVRAVRCSPDQILITSGTQQSLSLIARLLINPGDAVAFENPGYLSGRRVFAASGATLLPVPVDNDGLQIDGPNGLKGVTQAHSPQLVYVTPSHQFPTGVLMSLSRRLAFLQWAEKAKALIIEDDYDSEFRYSGRPIPALQGLDNHSRVLYVGTFSKVMFPGLQIGYIVVPPSLMPIFQRAKWLSDRQSSLIHQRTLTAFMRDGHLAKHVRRMRTLYDGRRRSLVTALSQIKIPESVKIFGDEAGLHVMAQLPTQGRDQQLMAAARLQGVSLFSAQRHYCLPSGSVASVELAQTPQGKFIFGFGAIDEAEIETAIAKLQLTLLQLTSSANSL